MENNTKKWILDGLVRFALLGGIVYFGFIFPDSFSNHEKLLHFSAHVGMSFLIASCVYVICNIRFRIGKFTSIGILVGATLVIGAIYKYLEISGQGMLNNSYNLWDLLTITGCYTSMSQNMAGVLAAILLIEYAGSYLKKQLLSHPGWRLPA
jgi:hypothetical protein